MFLGEKKKGLGDACDCPIGDQKQFLSNSLWEGDLAGGKKHFQENKCELERPRSLFSPAPRLLFQASLNSHVPGGQMGSHLGATLGIPIPTATGQTEEFFCLWRIFEELQ